MSAFQMFKSKAEQRQKQKKENVVSFIKAENEKKKKRKEEMKQKAETEGKKRRRRGKRKTREEKEAQRDEQLTRSVDKSLAIQEANKNHGKKNNGIKNNKSDSKSPKRNLAMQKEDMEKLVAMGKSSGAFVSHARKKMEDKVRGKRKRGNDDDDDEEAEETHQSQAKSQMELIFGKSAEKVKPGSYQHNRILITSEKMETLVEAAKGKKAAKKKRKENRTGPNGDGGNSRRDGSAERERVFESAAALVDFTEEHIEEAAVLSNAGLRGKIHAGGAAERYSWLA